jgi:carbon monoxide dehydrogenase subunit G
MELKNDFRVSVPVSQAWEVLTDLERVAPCMPGAELQEIEGDEYRGVVKVKVGPITAQYKGSARLVERDEEARRAVLRAEGRDTRGQGNASATIVATLTPDGDGTAVSIVTDLSITGKVAQFGRGVLADVSSKLMGQFVDQLEADVLRPSNEPGAPNGPAPSEEPAQQHGPAVAAAGPGVESGSGSEPGLRANQSDDPAAPGDGTAPAEVTVRVLPSKPAEPVDLLATAGQPVLRRLAPLGVAALVIALVWRIRRRR